jgi:hypothetical protein
MTTTGYYATIDTPMDRNRIGAFVKREVLTKHSTRDEAYAEARRIAATRPGTKGGILAAIHVEG